MTKWQSAWAWAEWVWTSFSFWSAGCPKDVKSYREALGPYRCSVAQCNAFKGLLDDVHRFGRLEPSAKAPGRGQKRLLQFVSRFENEFDEETSAASWRKHAECGALPVDPSRVAVPEKAVWKARR